MTKAVKLLGALAFAGSWSAQAAPIDLDLTGLTTSGVINGATFTRATLQPGGTGVIGSFVQLESPANSSNEQAFNTTVNNAFDNKSADNFNREITVGGTGFIDLNGDSADGEVMRFILDVNENGGGDRLISLSEVQIFLSRAPNQAAPASPANGALLGLGNIFKVYQMDEGDDNSVTLDADLSPGSGGTDMFLDIPLLMFNSAFTAGGFNTVDDRNNAYIYLYSRFADATGGFEEWAAVQGSRLVDLPCDPSVEDCDGQEVPEPGALSLFAIGLGGAAVMARRRRKL